VRVLYEHPDSSLPLLIAIERGFLRERNLQVSITRLTETDSTKLDSDLWDVNIGVALHQLPDNERLFKYVRLFQAQYSTAAGPMSSAVIVRVDSGINTISDLKGKVIVMRNPGVKSLEPMLKAHGLRWDSTTTDVTVRINSRPDFYKDMDQGAAVLTSGHTAARLLAERPRDYKVLAKNIEARYLVDPFYTHVSFVRANFFTTNEQAVWALLQGLDQAADWITKNSAAARGVIPKYFVDFSATEALRMPLPAFHRSTDSVDKAKLRIVRWKDVADLEKYYLSRAKG
jgi:ABC-type nitrate/sulfonate/bicarbonate transport system substrate-binding protein